MRRWYILSLYSIRYFVNFIVIIFFLFFSIVISIIIIVIIIVIVYCCFKSRSFFDKFIVYCLVTVFLLCFFWVCYIIFKSYFFASCWVVLFCWCWYIGFKRVISICGGFIVLFFWSWSYLRWYRFLERLLCYIISVI